MPFYARSCYSCYSLNLEFKISFFIFIFSLTLAISYLRVILRNFRSITGMERREYEMERLGLWRRARSQNPAASVMETRCPYV